MATGTLSIVATPIGNLEDISQRAIRTLHSADAIACEDSRVTGTLLKALGGEKKTLVSYHQHSSYDTVERLYALLLEGKNVALVTDAGSPGISDPGNELIRALLDRDTTIQIVPIPGASAVIAALSISGFPADSFLFLGFPPHKHKRKKFFETVANSEYTTVCYESAHRIKKTLEELAKIIHPKRRVCVCRELTKKFESAYRGTIEEVMRMNMPDKGEFVIIVEAVSERGVS